MRSDLADFIGRHEPLAAETAVWGNGRFPLQITHYLSQSLPPQPYVSSVRAVVFRGNCVLTVSGPHGDYYIVPGGRREADESLQETAQREVLEETGWTIQLGPILSFTHFHHLSPKPDDYVYPHPDFIQLIYLAEAKEQQQNNKIYDQWVADSHFYPLAEAMARLQSKSQRLLLQAAIACRA
jgi:8-oxo-dGTP pyrophosphatase MutT (NUDIX family)